MLPQVWARLGVCGKPSETKTRNNRNRLQLVNRGGAKRNQNRGAVSKDGGAKRNPKGSVVSNNGGAKSKTHIIYFLRGVLLAYTLSKLMGSSACGASFYLQNRRVRRTYRL